MTTTAWILSVVALTLLAGFVVAAYLRRWQWTGFTGSGGERQSRKTLWDWLQLLVVPVGLAAVAFWLNAAQSSRAQHDEDRRAALERSIAADQRREDALRAYLAQMSDLILERRLRTAPAGSASPAIAKTLTFTVLRRLDGGRKGIVLQFLGDGGLIRAGTGSDGRPKATISLAGADLAGVVVRGHFEHANLQGADLNGADFRRSAVSGDFRDATMRGADFGGGIVAGRFDDADLRDAAFHGAIIDNASFGDADLQRANLTHVDLHRVDFHEADLRRADFDHSLIESAKFRDADLRSANFSYTWLFDSAFAGACITRAQLTHAYLRNDLLQRASGSHIDLSDAELENIDLRNALSEDIDLAGSRLRRSHPPGANELAAAKDPGCANF